MCVCVANEYVGGCERYIAERVNYVHIRVVSHCEGFWVCEMFVFVVEVHGVVKCSLSQLC